MKCNCKIVLKEARRVGSGKPYMRVSKTLYPTEPGYVTAETDLDAGVCGGTITAHVSAAIDGGCGCCGFADLEITYKCDKCDSGFYKELPTNSTISDFLTVMISRLTDDDLASIDAHSVLFESTKSELYSYHDKGATSKSKRMKELSKKLTSMHTRCGLEA